MSTTATATESKGVSAGWVLCTGVCGQGTAGKTKHRTSSAIGAACGMASNRRRRGAAPTNNLVTPPVSAKANEDSYTGPDWNDGETMDNVLNVMLTHYKEKYGEDSDAFRKTKKYRKEIDYRLKAGLKEHEVSADFDDFANKITHDPALRDYIMEDYGMTAEDAQTSIDELESRIRNPENIEETLEENAEVAAKRRLTALANEAEQLQDFFDANQDKFDRFEEIKSEFREAAVEYAVDHEKEWMDIGRIHARFTPNTVLDAEAALEVIPKAQRKALLKPEAYDPKMIREWLINSKKHSEADFTSDGNGSFSFKILDEAPVVEEATTKAPPRPKKKG